MSVTAATLLLPQLTEWGPQNAKGGPTSPLGHSNLQCLNFPIYKMSIILSALPPLQTYCAIQTKQCVEGLWEKTHKALYDLRVVSSSPILLYYPPDTLPFCWVAPNRIIMGRRNTLFYHNPVKDLLWVGAGNQDSHRNISLLNFLIKVAPMAHKVNHFTPSALQWPLSRARNCLGEQVATCKSQDAFLSAQRQGLSFLPLLALGSGNASRFVILRMAGFLTLCSRLD